MCIRDRAGALLKAIVLPQLADGVADDPVAGHLAGVGVHRVLIAEERRVVRQAVHLDKILPPRGLGRRLRQHPAHILLLLAEVQQLGESAVREHLLPALFLIFLQQLCRRVQLGHLFFKVHLPQLFDAPVGLVLKAGIIEVALDIFVHQKAFQPGAVGVDQRPVLGDVLLLDHADLLVQLAAPVAAVKRAQVHIIVHCLLLRGGDDAHVQLGDGRGRLEIAVPAHAVIGVAVLRDGRAAGHDLGIAAHQPLCVYALLHLQQIGIAVQMVKILQQGQVHGLDHIGVRVPLGQDGGQVYGQLFVGDGGLQLGLVDGLQAGQLLLLLLLHPAAQRQLAPQVVVGAVPVELMAEPVRLKFGAGHQDDAHLGVGVGLVFVIGLGIKGFPVHQAVFHFCRFQFKRVHLFVPPCQRSSASCTGTSSGSCGRPV